jgi:hypothetical protein
MMIMISANKIIRYHDNHENLRSKLRRRLFCQLTVFPPNPPWYSICHTCGSI